MSDPKLRPIPATMRHTVYKPGCDAQGLSLGQGPVPQASRGEVLIQVAYCGVGGTDLAQRRGQFNPKADAPAHHLIMGLEVSGLVAAVGEGVSDFKAGDRVCAVLYGGGYAEYAVAPQEQVLEIPACMTMQTAAAVPENFWTVWVNVFSKEFGNLLDKPREKTFLVHGGAGGIGSTAVMLAHHFGARVVTTEGSDEKCEAARRFGADFAINYSKDDFVQKIKEHTGGHGADVILCFIGGDYVGKHIEALADYGRLIQIGLRKGQVVTFDLKLLMHKYGVLTGGHLRPRSIAQKGEIRDALRKHVLPAWSAGKLPMPQVQKILPLGDASKAHAMMEAGQIVGKVLLDPSLVAQSAL
eukprot:TRINITY_DN8545_c0_g1_i5.p1 TRINITY_DN8545_c0_g1~~TRINITY_DN8545_c0_g1_i5.p1  ORF type:complete len:355 (+),score=55.49 TRINITY_DN8545_c0_g1_i5:82-1146(+)